MSGWNKEPETRYGGEDPMGRDYRPQQDEEENYIKIIKKHSFQGFLFVFSILTLIWIVFLIIMWLTTEISEFVGK